jgi:hypothetical protein
VFGLIEIVALVIDDEIELGSFWEARWLVYDETAVPNSSANRRHHGEGSTQSPEGIARPG